MSSLRTELEAIAEWRRAVGIPYQAAFVISLLALGTSFVAGFVESSRYFDLPPIQGDATVLGHLLLERGEFLPALEEFRLAGLIDPENYASELTFQRSGGGAPAAVEKGRQQVQQRPEDPAAHFFLGRALLRDGQITESVRSLERARDLNPELRALQGTLGRALLEAGSTEAAERAYRQAIAREPSNPDWLEGLGLALYWSGRPDEAAEHFGRARTLRERSQRRPR